MDYWALMDEAIAEERGDIEDSCTGCVAVYLPDGGVHICKGAACPHVELNDDKCYVCTYSGLVVGVVTVRDDVNVGRQRTSANPDDHAGEPLGGSWKPKRDMMALSQQAYHASQTWEEEQIFFVDPVKAAPRTPVKRGARCVDEEPGPEETPKRSRQMRRASETREAFAAMVSEAEMTMTKLVNFDRRLDGKSKSCAPRYSASQDENTLFIDAIKKYMKESLATASPPTMDAVHNIALQARKTALEEKEAMRVEEGRAALLLKVRMRELVTTLAVLLWTASNKSPYMCERKRSADSFRPFVCGVLYALKRGVKLPDGTAVVPELPELAAALPALRATASNSIAKALHASSHRGLCTLHRSISSCDPVTASRLFFDAARQCAQLENSAKKRMFDI